MGQIISEGLEILVNKTLYVPGCVNLETSKLYSVFIFDKKTYVHTLQILRILF